jgi:hypothetical protein
VLHGGVGSRENRSGAAAERSRDGGPGRRGRLRPKKGKNGTYVCMHQDGHDIVCGGVTTMDKRKCDPFIVQPGSQAPTRDEAAEASCASVEDMAGSVSKRLRLR